jgi:hypothetical protein
VAEDLLHHAQILGFAQRAHAGGVAQVVDPGVNAEQHSLTVNHKRALAISKCGNGLMGAVA